MNKDLPIRWVKTELGQVIDYGKTQKIEPTQIPDNAWVLELEDIEKGSSKILQRLNFSERRSKSTKNRFEKGDVLYGKLRPYLNKVVIADQDGYCTTEIVPLKPNLLINGRYLFYWLKNPVFLEYVDSVSHGIQMPRLGTEAGLKAPLVLPPLNEQRRIVEKLDRIFDRLRRVRDELSHIKKLIDRYKQAVLTAACSGNLREDWQTINLGDLIIGSIKNGLYKPQSHYGNGTPIVRIDSFYDGEVKSWESLKRLEISEQEKRDFALEANDLLVNRVNSPEYVGKSAIIRNLPEPCVFESNIMRLKVNPSKVLPEYCIYFLRSGIGLQQLRKNVKHAVNQSSINQTDVKAVKVNVPPLEEQKEIVRRIEERFSKIDKIEQEYQKAVKLCDRLEQETLAKAFRGELVPQDPNDEPASVLLERIRSEKKTLTQPKGKSRRQK